MKVIATLASNGRHFGSVTVSIRAVSISCSHNPSSIEARSGPPNQEVGCPKTDGNIVMQITKNTIPPRGEPKQLAPLLHRRPAALLGPKRRSPGSWGQPGLSGPLIEGAWGRESDPASKTIDARTSPDCDADHKASLCRLKL
jgi:hypothetical protein